MVCSFDTVLFSLSSLRWWWQTNNKFCLLLLFSKEVCSTGSLFVPKGSLLFPLHSLSHNNQKLFTPLVVHLLPPRPPTTLVVSSNSPTPVERSEPHRLALYLFSRQNNTPTHIINFAHIKLNLKIYIPTYKIQLTTYTTNKKKHTKCEWVRNWPCARGNTALNWN